MKHGADKRERYRHGLSARLMQAACLGAVVLFTSLQQLGCADAGNADQPARTVVLYVSADDYIARQIIAAFEEKSGIEVKMVGDTEATKTTGLVNRIREEADRPVADVFWSSECFMMIQLADEGLLEPYVSDTTRDWPESLRDDEHLWHGFAPRARVIVYAPGRVAEEDIPRTWLDLGKSRYRGRVVMADPRFGTTRGHMGAMLELWGRQFGEGAFIGYLENLQENEIRLLPTGNAGVVQAVANGEADFGMTDTDDVWAAQRNGHDVALVYPSHGLAGERGMGTLLIPNTVARVKGGTNVEEAAELIEFLLSTDVERMLAASDSHNIPIREELAEEFSEYAVPDPLRISLEAAAAQMDRAVDLAMQYLSPSQ